jgi:hypothetical protein
VTALKSSRQYFGWYLSGACFYIVDCIVASNVPDVPWIERGIYAGPGFFITVGWMVFPLILVIKERVDTQPRR